MFAVSISETACGLLATRPQPGWGTKLYLKETIFTNDIPLIATEDMFSECVCIRHRKLRQPQASNEVELNFFRVLGHYALESTQRLTAMSTRNPS